MPPGIELIKLFAFWTFLSLTLDSKYLHKNRGGKNNIKNKRNYSL